MQTRRIDIGPVELELVEAGEGGRPLLLLHGFTGTKEDFSDWFGALAAEGWHVVAPDQRGHGSSAKPDTEADYSLEQFASDALALADRLGFERFAVLGHSMGGMLTQHLVLAAPHRVTALVLMDTHHGSLDSVDPQLVTMGIELARAQGMEVVADVVAAMGEDDPLVTPAYREMIERRPERKVQSDANLRAVAPAMYAAMLAAITSAATEDRLAHLAGLDVPTLVMVGEQDAPFLVASERMAATIPGARLAVIPGGGHSPQLEAPDAWWEALAGFLAAVAAESGDAGDAGVPSVAEAGR